MLDLKEKITIKNEKKENKVITCEDLQREANLNWAMVDLKEQ